MWRRLFLLYNVLVFYCILGIFGVYATIVGACIYHRAVKRIRQRGDLSLNTKLTASSRGELP